MYFKSLHKRIVLLFLAILLAYPVFSQENYLSGFVLLSSEDTVHGYIDYRNWRINPDEISFKKDLSDNKIIYTPLSCKGFGVMDEIYESGIINTEISPTKTSQLDDKSELRIRIDTTFLQAIILGKKSLYYYVNDLGNEQFYIKKDTVYELLIYKKYLKNGNQGRSIIENKKFIGQLLIYFNDCQTIQSEIKKLEYRRKSIQNLFLSYYESTKSKIEFEKKVEKVAAELAVLAGCSFVPERNKDNSGVTYPSWTYHNEMSLNMAFGLSLNLILPRTQKKWSIYNELVYSAYYADFHQVDYKNEDEYTIWDYHGKIKMLQLSTNLRFQYPFKKATVYSYFGAWGGYFVERNGYSKQETIFHSLDTIEEEYDSGSYSSTGVGLNFGLGVYYKRFSFAAGLDSFFRYKFLVGYKL